MREKAPAAERNKGPILEVLRRVLPSSGLVLEIASGTGQHAAHFAAHLPHITWQPSDVSDRARVSIAAWGRHLGRENLRPPLALDVTDPVLPITAADAMFCANMIHIAPWEAAEGLMRVAESVLSPGAPLVVYGPFIIEGRDTAPSNLAFDRSLRSRDPRWGVRRLSDVVDVSKALSVEEVIDMPANNFSVVLRRAE